MVILELEEQPPLIQSIFAGDVEEVRNLLSQQQDVNFLDTEKRSPLHAAAFKGDPAIVSLLLIHGARVNAKDNKWYTPLHRASCTGSEETVCLLLRYQADTSARDRLWQTPLHVSAANDAYQCVTQLLQHVPNPNLTDRSGWTALHHSAYNGHTDVAELLISKGCMVNACDKKDCRPLHWASYMGHVNTMDLLLQNGADINAKDRNQYSPLHVVAASGMENACQLLLNAGAEVDIQNSYGNTPLHVACLNGHSPICQELVAYGANLEATNYRGQTPLHIAAASTHGVDCLIFLLEQNIDINRQSLDGRTALHMTAIHGKFTRSNMLINRGAAIDCADKNGCTALHIAAQCGTELLTYTLLSYGADPSRKGYEGRTPLHMCCLSGFVECCRKFVQAGVDINARDDSGKTPTHCAAYKGSVGCLDLLVSNGADFQIRDNTGRIPLHYAVLEGNYQCVFTLVSIGSPVNCTDAEGCTCLHLAAAYDYAGKCVDYLIQHKADPTVKDNNGYTAVHYAVAGRNFQALSSLLSAVGTKFPLYGSDMPPTTPLHLSARNGNLEILRMILPYFPDTNIKTAQGSTPLLLAAKEGHAHCVQMLLRYGAKVNLTDRVSEMSPVHWSAKNGHVHCLALLLDNTEDKSVIDKPDGLQRTALMLAVSGNHGECVLTLLKSGADPNVTDADGHSSLFRAVVAGQNGIVQLLIAEGAKVGIRDVHGKTVLHLAAACGHTTCLQTVHSYMSGDEAATLDNQQCSTLHWACYVGNAKCVEYLLEQEVFKRLEGNAFSAAHCASFSGSERCLELLCNYYGGEIVQLEDSRRRRPLHIAAFHGHAECVKYLLGEGAETEVYDDEGRTPLIVAAQNGQSSVIEILIKHRSDVMACDTKGNTALHWACLKKHSHSALLLLEYVNDAKMVNVTNSEMKTALHLAARNGLVQVTRKLLKNGASVLAVDTEGLTPALCCTPNAQVARCLSLILKCYPQFTSAQSATFQDLPRHSASFLMTTKNKLKTFASQKCQTEISRLSLPQNLTEYECECVDLQTIDLPSFEFYHSEPSGLNLHHSRSNVHIAFQRIHNDYVAVNGACAECDVLRRKCATCTLRKLMRQHIIGRLKVDDLKTTLNRICSDAGAEYKRTMIRALENFKENIREKKTHLKKNVTANRIENIIDAVLLTRNSLLKTNVGKDESEREDDFPFLSLESHGEIRVISPPKCSRQIDKEKDFPTDNLKKKKRTQKILKSPQRKEARNGENFRADATVLEELYQKKDRPKRQTAVRAECAERPTLRVIESTSDDAILKMDRMGDVEEAVKKRTTESFQSLQKTKMVSDVFASLEAPVNERDERETIKKDDDIAEYIRGLIEERIPIYLPDKSETDTFFVEEESAETLYTTRVYENEREYHDPVGKGEMSEEMHTVGGEPEPRRESELNEIDGKTIISGSISLVEYDSVRNDEIWKEIDIKVMETKTKMPEETKECVENLGADPVSGTEEEKESVDDEQEDTANERTELKTKRRSGKIKDNNSCLLS